MKINKIPFSLEKYESDNYRIVTRDGRDARVICKDRTDKNYPIVALIKDNGNEFIHVYSKNGESIIDEESIYDLFLVNQVFKKGDIIHFQNEDDETAIFNFREGKYVYIYFYYNDRNGTICYNDIIADNFRIATEEEKQKMFDALAKEGKRWNAENKCIEDIKKEYQFKPFDKVLVRDCERDLWEISFFGNYSKRPEYRYKCMNSFYHECIPFDGNEELLGTTNDCPTIYKNV